MHSRHHSNGDGDSTAPGITSRVNDGTARGGGGGGSSTGGSSSESSTGHLRVVGTSGEGVEQVRANAGRQRPGGPQSSATLRALGRTVSEDDLGELGGLLGRAHGNMRPPSQEEVLAQLRSGVREELQSLATGQGKSASRAKLRVRTIYDYLTTSDSGWISAAKWAGVGLLLTASAVAAWAIIDALTSGSAQAAATGGMALLGLL